MAALSDRARAALDILQRFEKDTIQIVPLLGSALEVSPVKFVVFACLGTERGREELVLNVSGTIFLKRYARRAKELFQAFAETGIETELQIILEDMEPRRTWGWSSFQAEITAGCQMMAKDAREQLPKNWSVVLWSDLERQAGTAQGYDEALARTAFFTDPRIVKGECEFFERFAELHPDIVARRTPRELALRQVTAYAHEGRTLECLSPGAILLQADTPVDRKDAMFQASREKLLPIAHPFTT